MTYIVKRTSQFKKSYKLAVRRGLDVSLLEDVINKLKDGITLELAFGLFEAGNDSDADARRYRHAFRLVRNVNNLIMRNIQEYKKMNALKIVLPIAMRPSKQSQRKTTGNLSVWLRSYFLVMIWK